MADTTEKEWQCSHCGEKHEVHMTGCWKCGAEKDGSRMFVEIATEDDKKSSEAITEEYQGIIQRVEQKYLYQIRSMGLLFALFILLGVAQAYENHVAAVVLAVLSLFTLLLLLFFRVTMGAIYRCPQCDAKLTLNSKRRGFFNFEVAPLSHCHHCGETLES